MLYFKQQGHLLEVTHVFIFMLIFVPFCHHLLAHPPCSALPGLQQPVDQGFMSLGFKVLIFLVRHIRKGLSSQIHKSHLVDIQTNG